MIISHARVLTEVRVPEPYGPEPWAKFDIIQPVLELFGNEGWQLQSWYVPLPGMAKTSRKMVLSLAQLLFVRL